MSEDDDELLVLRDRIPELRPRTVDRHAREGRYPGAIKVGRVWMIPRRAWRAWMQRQAPGIPTLEEAAGMLRDRGYRSAAEADLLRAGFKFNR